MAEKMSQTLLLGLGGTGSRIVNHVAADLKKKKIKINDGNVCCAVLDTNDNDRKKLKNKGVGIPIIPTSKERTIADYVKIYKDHDVESWLPRSASFYQESMLDGASQMRPKSRLALMDSIEDKTTIYKLAEVIDTMFENRDEAKIRVMIVSSLAGGTGSGMFIQTALWLRQYFAKKKCQITIRGIFLLPDIFIDTVENIRNDDQQIESVYANAYGAIRELNALTKIKLHGFEPSLPVKIDNLFDSERDRLAGEPIFNYAFFMDNITENGAVLSNIEHYEQVAARLVYMQLYAPAHDDMYSEEDNLFKQFALTPEPVFGSCGTAKAVYPVEDVRDYCVLSSVRDAISSGWRKIDDEIKAKQKKEDEMEDQGRTLKRRIVPRNEYMRLFESKTDKEGTQVGREKLFVKIANDINNDEYVIGEDGMAVPQPVDKIASFISLIKEQVARKVDTDNPGALAEFKLSDKWLKRAEDDGDVNNSGDDRETLSKLVKKKEKEVIRLLDAIDESAEEMAEDLLELICPTDMGDVNQENLISVLGLLTKKNSNEESYFVHPVAVRYLLYKLAETLEADKKGAALPVIRKSAINGHGKVGKETKRKVEFDNPKTGEVEDSPEAYLNSKSFWHMQKEATFLKYFKQKYAEFNVTQYEICRAYAIELIYHKLAILLSQRLEEMIDLVEVFFRNLTKVTKTLNAEIEKNAKKNERKEQKIVFVCASREEKRALYDSLRFNAADSDDRNINSMIVRALYGQFCAKLSPDAEANKTYKETDLINSFYNDAIKSYRKYLIQNYRDDIDMDIYTAICRSSDFEYEKEQREKAEELTLEVSDILEIDSETGECVSDDSASTRHAEAVEEMVQRIYKASAPFLICDSFDAEEVYVKESETEEVTPKGEKIPMKRATFWGFNPVIADKYPEFGSKFKFNLSSHASDKYLKNELDCYRAIYGIQAGDVDKFNELKGGDYYTNYRRVVDRMIQGVAADKEESLVQTPHLDKTWHLILPYITPEMQRQDDERFYRRFWLAIAYGMIYVANDGKFKIKRKKYTETGTSYQEIEPLIYNDKPIGKVDVLELLAALRVDGAFMMDAEELEQKFTLECENLDNYEGTEFLRGKVIKEVIKKSEDGETVKTQTGGLATKGDTNAITLIVRYFNSKKHRNDVTATLINYLEKLCYELVQNKYEKNEHEKIRLKSFEICRRIFVASAMKNKDIPLLAHWKEAWSKGVIEE